MKELKDMTAAELVAKLAQDKIVKCANHSCYHANPPHLLGDFCEKCGSGLFKKWCYVQEVDPKYLDKVLAELDARCEKWEFSISDGGGIVFNDSEHIKIYTSHDIGDSVTIRDAAEFHALIGYLLSKGVKP